MNNKKRNQFNKILKDIKSIKIQGARNVAKQGLKAYFLIPTKKSKEKILNCRATEPMLSHVLNLAEKGIPEKEIILHFNQSQEKINQSVFKLIKNNDVAFTHCHSTNVINSLIYSKNKGKIFTVVNTETRPLFQGRKTAKELAKAGIKITQYVDSGARIAIIRKQGDIQVDKIFLGADALLKKGIINKIGSGMFAEIAYDNKVPVYIVADSWKFSKNKIPIEQRNLVEVWDNAPKNIKIKNPAFEFIPVKYISGIITEFGLMKYRDFVKRMS
jgi:translation initiation factor 2B subunit (eIF-2B alpha/beta/delta family)